MFALLPSSTDLTTVKYAIRRRRHRCKHAMQVRSEVTGSLRQQKVAVVGGGVGGLALAGRLAKEGLDVVVLEKNDKVGGRAQSVEVGGFRFDTGPSLLLFPDKYHEAFAAMGHNCEEFFQMQRVEPAAYRVFFGDGSCLDMLYDVQQMMQQLERVEQGAGAAYLRFLSTSRALLEGGMSNFIERNVDSVVDFLDLPRLLPLLTQVALPDLLAPHHSRLGHYFRDARLRAMFSFQDLYVGLSPYDAPAVFSLLVGTELTDGVWYPLGGFCKVVDGLWQAVERNRVRVRCGCRVSEVVVDNSGVTGVRLEGGEFIAADVVVANADVAIAYTLLKNPYGAQRASELRDKQYSAGVISFNWCLDQSFPRLLHHNVFLSDEYDASWKRARRAADIVQRPNFYIHVPNRTDASAAPTGCDSVMVLLPVANMQERGRIGLEGTYDELVSAGRDAVLSTLRSSGVGDLSAHITHEFVYTPPQWHDMYALQHGAAFGLSHGLDQLALFRPANEDPKVSGLFFVGASTRPGNGVPLSFISASLTSEKVLKSLRPS